MDVVEFKKRFMPFYESEPAPYQEHVSRRHRGTDRPYTTKLTQICSQEHLIKRRFVHTPPSDNISRRNTSGIKEIGSLYQIPPFYTKLAKNDINGTIIPQRNSIFIPQIKIFSYFCAVIFIFRNRLSHNYYH